MSSLAGKNVGQVANLSYKQRLASTASRLALLATLLLALLLRVHRLDVQSLWYDEAVTAHVAAQGIAELTRWTADDIQPPLYYYVVAGWTRVAGNREWALRFPSAFCSTLTVALIWGLARRLYGGRSGWVARLAAALLAALSPLYVYYAQEARMYAQLTFLGMLAGYALLRAVGGEEARATQGRGAAGWRRPAIWWATFVLASVAALYTHYFAAFLLLAFGICVGAASLPGLLRPESRRRAASHLIAFAAAGLAIVVLYLPWLPAMLTRYRVDRSYWQGPLKLGEALRHVAVSFAAGAPETMLEADAVRLLPWFGAVLGVAAAALVLAPLRGSRFAGAEERGSGGAGQQGSRFAGTEGMRSLVYLSICLLVPVVFILALASRTPKFNARYLMMVSPAYLLIVAGGIGALVSRPTHNALRLLAAVLLVFLVFVSTMSLRNWFTNPAFTKAQWRQAAAAVRKRIAADETVVLVSGHAWPAWDYYAPDIPRVRLPDIDILDVDAVLGFGDGQALQQALAGKSGVWLLRWQDEAVDPVGFVPYFLDRAGREEPFSGQYWHLSLRHWRLRSDASFPTEPHPAHADGANFSHKLALLGWDDPANGMITLYWRTINLMDRDFKVSLILLDAAGREMGRWDGRPAGYNYPTTRWRVGQALFGTIPLPLPAGAAPGDYSVTIAVYDDVDPSGLDIRDVGDNPAGKRVRLGPFKVNGG